MRFIRYFIFTISFFVFSTISVSAQTIPSFSQTDSSLANLTAQSAILIENSTGRVLFEKNADARQYPASMTKMMTTILSLEMSKPDDLVYIHDDAATADGSAVGLQKGDIITMGELRQAMMLISGNDAAVAIADAISGSVPVFADLMNQKAVDIGAVNTHFINPNGLPNPNHYSTARDMVKIAAYAYKNKDFQQIVSTKKKEIQWVNPNKKDIFENTNHLLWNYPYANGIKTGYTDDAGGCLTASATKDGVTLIAVIMHTENAPDRFKEAQELLDYGFKNVHLQRGYKKADLIQPLHVHGGKIPEINVEPQSDIDYPLLNEENSSAYSIKVNLPHYLAAPIKAGDKAGSIDILYNNEKIGEVPMIADRSSYTGFNIKSLYYYVYDSVADFLATV